MSNIILEGGKSSEDLKGLTRPGEGMEGIPENKC